MRFFSVEEYKLVTGNSDKKGVARRELRTRTRKKIANALAEVELAFSNAEILLNAEHLPAQALKTAIAGFKTLGLIELSKKLEELYEASLTEIAKIKALREALA